jgi:hypothetical protein
MTSPATYGELMLKAALGVHRGIAQVQGLPFDRPEEARAAVDGFYDVLRAAAAHTWRLLEPWRIPGVLSGQSPDPRERAAVHLGDALEDLVAQHPRPLPSTPADSSPWAGAAVAMRAADELVASHEGPHGAARSPDAEAVLRDPGAHQAGLALVGDLAATLLGSVDHLALRAGQVGVPWGQVRAALPDLAEVRAIARDVAGLGPLPTSERLEALTTAHISIRTGDPIVEVQDRTRRLRLHAWLVAHDPHPSVGDLQAFAVLGIAIHAHALSSRGHSPARLREGIPAHPDVLHLVVRGRAWQDVNRALLTWRSTQPGDTVVAGDVARVTGRLRDLAPLVGDQPDLAVGEQRRLGDALAQATDTLGDVGRWSRRTLERMGHAHQVLVPGHLLSGEQVTDDAIRAAAKLDHRYTPVPDAVLDDCGHLYARTYPSPNLALTGAGGLGLRVEPAGSARSDRLPVMSREPITRAR